MSAMSAGTAALPCPRAEDIASESPVSLLRVAYSAAMAPDTLRDDVDAVPPQGPTVVEQLMRHRRYFGDRFPLLLALAQAQGEERPRERRNEEFEDWNGIS